MKRTLLIFVFVVGLVLACNGVYAQGAYQDGIDLARNVIQAQRQLAIFNAMNLSEGEQKAFWPLYEEYRAKVLGTNDRLVELIREYSGTYEVVSNEKALEMLNELVTIDESQLKIKKEYIKKFQKVLPGLKVARFFQMENKLDSMMDSNLAAQIPLIGGTEQQ